MKKTSMKNTPAMDPRAYATIECDLEDAEALLRVATDVLERAAANTAPYDGCPGDSVLRANIERLAQVAEDLRDRLRQLTSSIDV